MLRLGAVSVVVPLACLIACGSANDEGLFGPPNSNVWKGGASSSGGEGSGGIATGGGTSGGTTGAGGAAETGGEPATGGIPGTGGIPAAGGIAANSGGLDGSGGRPATGGFSPGGQGGTGEKATPGEISCDYTPCPTDGMPANTCCVGRPGFATFCFPEAVSCGLSGASPVYCDDAADCGGNAICCAAMSGTVPTASCKAECSGEGSTVQLCRTTAECAGGRVCKPWSEFAEYSACQ